MAVIRISENPLPRVWHTHPKAVAKDIIGEAELRISPHSRLRAKLLIFRNNKAMRKFFKDVLGKPESVCKKTLGVVSGLSYDVFDFSKPGSESVYFEVDPRYFCVIGLLKDHLRMEIICHEAVHAGFAYAARQQRKQWVKGDVLDEEQVCYPAGRIASAINLFCHREGMYSESA